MAEDRRDVKKITQQFLKSHQNTEEEVVASDRTDRVFAGLTRLAVYQLKLVLYLLGLITVFVALRGIVFLDSVPCVLVPLVVITIMLYLYIKSVERGRWD